MNSIVNHGSNIVSIRDDMIAMSTIIDFHNNKTIVALILNKSMLINIFSIEQMN